VFLATVLAAARTVCKGPGTPLPCMRYVHCLPAPHARMAPRSASCRSLIAVGPVTQGPWGVPRTRCRPTRGKVGKQRSAALIAVDPLSLAAVTEKTAAEPI
jgi:hypothetical protein